MMKTNIFDIDIIFLDKTLERIRTSDWATTNNCLKVQIGRNQFRYFPLSAIKWWDSTKR